MADLEDGATIEMKGSGAKPYIIKNVGGVYSCTCPAWRNQSLQPYQRTCKHIRKLRGDAAEEERLGAAALNAPVRKAASEDKEGPPVLLAETWDAESNVLGWWMSEKLDGARAYWDGKQFISRLGNTFLAPDFFLDSLPNVPLDGELWMGRKMFTRTMSVIRRLDKPADWKDVRYVVFDAPAHGGRFEERMRYLEDLLGRHRSDFVQRLEHQPCRGTDHLLAELHRVSELGAEGLMLRQPGSLYEAGRSYTLLKVKRFHDAEARVVGHVAGAGKHKGRTGSLDVEMNGVRFAIGTGLSDAERHNPPPIGTVVTFRYQELSENGVPRFPSYVGIRADGMMTPAPKTPAVGVPPAPKPAAPVAPAVPAKAEPAPMSKLSTRTFEYGSGARAKIWEITLDGNRIHLRFGSPSAPENKTLTFASPDEAAREAIELIADKLEDGFVERGVDKPSPPIPAPPAAAAKPAEQVVPATPTSQPDGRRHFEFVEGSSSKFWEVWISGVRMTTCYGRIGSKGTMTIKDFADEAAARNAMDKAVGEKTRKGYVEQGTSEPAIHPVLRAVLAKPTEEAIEDLLDDESLVFVVDWREEDDAIIEACEGVLHTGALSADVVPGNSPQGPDLFVVFRDRRVPVPLQFNEGDRHVTLLALNQALAPEYEIRWCTDSDGSDTLVFLPLPVEQWAQLEQRYGQAVARRFERLTPQRNVFTE